VDKTASPAARKIAALLRTADPAAKKRILQQLVSLPANGRELPKQVQRAHEVNTKKLLGEPLSLLERVRTHGKFNRAVRGTLATPSTLQDLSEAGVDRMLKNRVALEKLPDALDRYAELQQHSPRRWDDRIHDIYERLKPIPSRKARRQVELLAQTDARQVPGFTPAGGWSQNKAEALYTRVRPQVIVPQASARALARYKLDTANEMRGKRARGVASNRLRRIIDKHTDWRRKLYKVDGRVLEEHGTLTPGNTPKALLSPDISSWKGTTKPDSLAPALIDSGFYSGYGPVGVHYATDPFIDGKHNAGVVWRAKRRLLDPAVREGSVYTPHLMTVDPIRRGHVASKKGLGGSRWDKQPEYEIIYQNVPDRALHPYVVIPEPGGGGGKSVYGVKNPKEFRQRMFELLTTFKNKPSVNRDKARIGIARYYGVNPADLPTS
jgi:hypothetical protein